MNESRRRKASVMRTKYTTGKQPCGEFKPQRDGNGYAEWDNEHQCYRCGGVVSFCMTCTKDHHAAGYETCTPEARTAYDEAERKRSAGE